MIRPSRPIVGRWRIIEADLWDRDHLDLCGTATLVIGAHGQGEIVFGAMQAGLDIDYGPDEIGFTWSGSAEFQDDGSFQIEFEYYNGDEAVLKPFENLLQQPAEAPESRPTRCTVPE